MHDIIYIAPHKGGKNSKKGYVIYMRVRVFQIVQQVKHQITGEPLMNEGQIKKGLAHRSIKRYAWILHNKDKYTEEDKKKNPDCVVGELKTDHYHIVGECPSAIDISIIAKWFGVPENFVEAEKGRGAFLDCVEYITHESDKEQAKGKALYPDEEMHANFDFRRELNERAARKLKYGKDLSPKEQMRYDVFYCGKTLKACREEDNLLYLDDFKKLKELRVEYLFSNSKPPMTRINYYICGEGGLGKGLLSKALARSLYPELTDDEDIFFCVGAKGSEFEGYDGQPVIIWSDRRAGDLLAELKGRGNVFEVFDTHPTRARQNIKYGSVVLCNEVNIVNSVEPYTDFLNALAGEYIDRDGNTHNAEDKNQSYRRFPCIIPIHEEDFDFLVNKGFVDGDNYGEYITYKNIQGSMRKLVMLCNGREELLRELERQTLKPITDKHTEILAKVNHAGDDKSDDDIKALLANYGKVTEVGNCTVDGKDKKKPFEVEGFEEISDEGVQAMLLDLFKKQ